MADGETAEGRREMADLLLVHKFTKLEILKIILR